METGTHSQRESRLCLLAQSGDRDALDRLLRCVQRDLYGYVHRLCRTDLADDVLQDVLVQVCRKLRWLRDPELFRPWCFRIAHRATFRAVRRERRRRKDPMGDAQLRTLASNAGHPPFDAEHLERLPRLLARLSPASSTVIVLHFLEQKTLAEVAATLGTPLGTVKSRLAYGLQRLRALGLRGSQDRTTRR